MLNIIYEDNEIIVCEKLSGIPSQGDKTGDPDMFSTILTYLIDTSKSKEPYLALVHRLDRAVGGIMVFAKTKKSAAYLSNEIQKNNFQKTYFAVTNGQAQKNDRLSDFLLKNQRLNVSKVVTQKIQNAKQSILEYQLVETFETDTHESLSLIEVNLITGRHHQIRVQLSHAGLPIWGDTKYNPNFIKKPGFHFIALWAYKLNFLHPKTNKPIEFILNPHEKYPFTEFHINTNFNSKPLL